MLNDVDLRQRVRQRDDFGYQRSEMVSGLDDGFDHKYATRQPKSAVRKWLVKLCIGLTIVNVVVGTLLMLVYLFVPSEVNPKSFQISRPPLLEGVLAPNNLLSKAERIMEGQILGPESIHMDLQGMLYTGTWDGRVVQIDKRAVTREVHLGSPPCDASYASEPDCGRPLGIRMDAENRLIVADSYLGIYRVNIWDGSKEVLVSGGMMVEKRPLRFINDLALLDDGSIVFTDSSSKWDRRRFSNIFMEMEGDGRLLMYNPTTKQVTLLMDALFFPNGVELSLDKQFVYVAECALARILKYYVAGPKRGTLELFVQHLPGFPDNVRLSSNGSLWVPMGGVRHAGAYSPHDALSQWPKLRLLFAKLLPSRLRTWLMKRNRHSMLLLVSPEGEIVSSLQDTTGQIEDVSQVTDTGTVLFLGSYHSPYIGRLDLDKL